MQRTWKNRKSDSGSHAADNPSYRRYGVHGLCESSSEGALWVKPTPLFCDDSNEKAKGPCGWSFGHRTFGGVAHIAASEKSTLDHWWINDLVFHMPRLNAHGLNCVFLCWVSDRYCQVFRSGSGHPTPGFVERFCKPTVHVSLDLAASGASERDGCERSGIQFDVLANRMVRRCLVWFGKLTTCLPVCEWGIGVADRVVQ